MKNVINMANYERESIYKRIKGSLLFTEDAVENEVNKVFSEKIAEHNIKGCLTLMELLWGWSKAGVFSHIYFEAYENFDEEIRSILIGNKDAYRNYVVWERKMKDRVDKKFERLARQIAANYDELEKLENEPFEEFEDENK